MVFERANIIAEFDRSTPESELKKTLASRKHYLLVVTQDVDAVEEGETDMKGNFIILRINNNYL